MVSRLRACAVGVALLCASAAGAASLKLQGGGRLNVDQALPTMGAPTSAASSLRPLAYSLVDSSGRTWSGTVPGSEGALPCDVSLAQNPATGDALLVFAVPAPGGRELLAMRWTGQQWTSSQPLTSSNADDRAPYLSYRPAGDALLAWVSNDSSVLLRHFDLAPGYESPTYSFVDVGTLEAIAGEAASRLGGRPRLAAVLGDPGALAAYVLLDSDTDAPLRVVRVELDSLVDPGGFGAAPVPVTFTRPTPQSGDPGAGLGGRTGAHVDGTAFDPWRLVLPRGSAWYWQEEDRVRVVTFRGAERGRLFELPLTGSEAALHVEVLRAVRAELGGATRSVEADGGIGSRRTR